MSAAGGSAVTPPACLVVDANVVIKWFVAENHTDAALRLLRDDAPVLHVPELLFPEVGNILWKKVRRGDLTADEARTIGRLVAQAPLEVHPSVPLGEAALEIALSTGRTVYDSQYVALAIQMDSRLVTADEKLYNALKRGPLGDHVLWIEDDIDIPAIEAAHDSVIPDDFVIPSVVPTHTADEIELLYSWYTGDRLTDVQLSQLVGLTNLRQLHLQSPTVTDAGLAHLRDLVELRTLYLGGTSVTDAGLIYLRGLTGLRTLGLKGTAITDVGLSHVGALAGLRWLDLHGTQVTDAGLVHLHDLTELRRLDLGGTSITDIGLIHLRNLTGLRTLDLAGTAITDAGLAHIGTLTGLHHLVLWGTRITDAGLVHLHALAGLLELDLDWTRVSEAAVEDLRRARPEVEIECKNVRGQR